MNDARLLAWRAIFDRDAIFDTSSAPAGMLEVLNAQTGPAPRGLFVSGKADPKLHQLSGYERVVIINGPRPSSRQLHADGFAWVRCFGIVPGIHDPRFLIPLASPRGTSRALGLYSPLTMKGRLARRGAIILARTSHPGWYRDHITIASREQPPFERRLRDLLGVEHPYLVFSTGRPLAQRKHTIGVLNDRGDWCAFIKDGEGPWARPALRNEARWLHRLRHLPIGDTVPRLLAEEEIRDGVRLIMSAGPERSAPMLFTRIHQRWLTDLMSSSLIRGTLEQSSLANRMQERWPTLQRQVTTAWQERLDEAYVMLQRMLGGRTLPLWASHGDFAPWNTRRMPDNRLFVFDWEMAQDSSLPLRDLFHFHFMLALTLGDGLHPTKTAAWIHEKAPAMPDVVTPSLLPALFLGYLIELALDYLDMLIARAGQQDDAVLTTIAQHLDHMDWWMNP